MTDRPLRELYPPTTTDRDALVEWIVAEVTGDPARSFVLRGPAGLGKSYVAAQVVDRLDRTDSGVAVRRVYAGEAQQALDFGALLHLLPADGPPVTAEFELIQRLRRGLVAQATPTVLVVDGVSLLDQKSAAIIEGLIRGGDVTVVATERTPPDGVRDDGHHLTSALRQHADGIVLGPLGIDRLMDLLVEWQGPGEVGSLRRLASLSAGNPLALRELLSSARASSSIAERAGLWHLTDFVPGGRSLEQLVESHLQRLSQAEWDLLRTVALAGSVSRVVIERIDDDALERLERRSLVAGDPCAIDHPLYSEVIRAQIVGHETRRLYTRLAAAVRPGDGVDEARVAEWLLLSDNDIDDDTARRGARVAVGRWENALARRLIDAISDPTSADLVQLVWAHANDGALDAAQRTAERAVAAAVTECERVDAGVTLAELWCLQLGRSEEGYAHLEELRSSVTDRDQLARIDSAAALYMRMTGKGTLAVASAAAANSASVTTDAGRLPVVLADAFDKVFGGAFHAAEDPIRTGYELSEQLGLPHLGVRVSITDAVRLFLLGDLAGAQRIVDHWIQFSGVSGAGPAHAVWLGMASQIAAFRGDYSRALLRGREAVRAADHVDDIGAGGYVRGELRAASVEIGLDVGRDEDESPLGGARCQLRLTADDEIDARASELTQRAVDAGYTLWAPWVGMEAVRRGPAPRTAPIVIDVASQTDGDLAAAVAAHARGDLEGDVDLVATAADQFLACGAVASGVDAMVTELEARAVSVDDDAVAARRRAVHLQTLVSAMTPHPPPRIAERLDRVAERLEMPSARQLEIARLVAAGRTSREVAAELVVSTRTVDNHLAAVYRRLGLSGRHELGDVVFDLPAVDA
jgi:DNA-binding NarL/FixJ family response regulator